MTAETYVLTYVQENFEYSRMFVSFAFQSYTSLSHASHRLVQGQPLRESFLRVTLTKCKRVLNIIFADINNSCTFCDLILAIR